MTIKTFIFFDLETTGLPTKERPAKITELTFLCVLRRDIEQADIKNLPPLPKPVCLVAHNGNCFDYKIIKSEYKSENAELPKDLLCVDSLKAFKEILKDFPYQLEKTNNSEVCTDSSNSQLDCASWPELDVTPEDWREIDNLIDSFSKLTSTPKTKTKQTKPLKMKYDLSSIYKTLLKKEPIGSHRAEADCMMLLECVIATKEQFLPWADKNHNLLSAIKH